MMKHHDGGEFLTMTMMTTFSFHDSRGCLPIFIMILTIIEDIGLLGDLLHLGEDMTLP